MNGLGRFGAVSVVVLAGSVIVAAAATPPKPGYAVGHVLTTAGKPITVPGAKIILAFHGTSQASGQRAEYTVAVKPDGSYEQRLADGSYHVFAAKVQVPFEGKSFLLPLESVTGDDAADHESGPGIVQDFVWKIHGPKPGKGDETKPGDWYGAVVSMKYDSYRSDLRRSVPRAPAGTKCVFTLKPQGKLIDGSTGKELTYTRPYDPVLGTLANGYLPDVPVGVYTISGHEVGPGGAKTPLLFWRADNTYGDSTEVRFEPATAWAGSRTVNFTRPAN